MARLPVGGPAGRGGGVTTLAGLMDVVVEGVRGGGVGGTGSLVSRAGAGGAACAGGGGAGSAGMLFNKKALGIGRCSGDELSVVVRLGGRGALESPPGDAEALARFPGGGPAGRGGGTSGTVAVAVAREEPGRREGVTGADGVWGVVGVAGVAAVATAGNEANGVD